jgi:hypothetical protein
MQSEPSLLSLSFLLILLSTYSSSAFLDFIAQTNNWSGRKMFINILVSTISSLSLFVLKILFQNSCVFHSIRAFKISCNKKQFVLILSFITLLSHMRRLYEKVL